MKKIITGFIFCLLLFALVGCSSSVNNPYIGDDGNWWIGTTNAGVKAAGTKGDKGDKGDQGLSAYELYVKYHPEYTKTEEEWVNEIYNNNKEAEFNIYGIYKVNKSSHEETFVFVDKTYLYSYTTSKETVSLADYEFVKSANYSEAYGYKNIAFLSSDEIVVKYSYDILSSNCLILDDYTLIFYGDGWYANATMYGALIQAFEE